MVTGVLSRLAAETRPKVKEKAKEAVLEQHFCPFVDGQTCRPDCPLWVDAEAVRGNIAFSSIRCLSPLISRTPIYSGGCCSFKAIAISLLNWRIA